MEQLIKVTCPQCQKEEMVKVSVIFHPEDLEDMISGQAFTHECQHCQQVNQIRYPMLYHHPDRQFMVYYEPDYGSQALDETYLKELIAEEGVDVSSYDLRRVDNPQDLVEKVTIFQAGYNDRLIEMVKILTDGVFGQQFEERKLHRRYFVDDQDEARFLYITDQGPLQVDLHQQLVDFVQDNHKKALQDLPQGQWLTVDSQDAYKIFGKEN